MKFLIKDDSTELSTPTFGSVPYNILFHYRCSSRITNDGLTLDLTDRVFEHIRTCTGHTPIMVVNNLYRGKLDPNRDEDSATYGEEIPKLVRNWYLGNISKAIDDCGGYPVLMLDIHGYSDDYVDRTLLGKYNYRNDFNFLPMCKHRHISHTLK